MTRAETSRDAGEPTPPRGGDTAAARREEVEVALGYRFRVPSLVARALRHRSACGAGI